MKTRTSPLSAAAGHGRCPVYVMIKPDADALAAICRQRRRLGMDERYDAARLHSTVLPVCDARDLTTELLARFGRAVARLSAEPFWIAFDRVIGTALRGGSMQYARNLQRDLLRWLIAFGVPIPPYEYRPHVSLAYQGRQPHIIPIPPIGWRVDELLLVESVHGEGRHVLHGRGRLTTRQHSFAF